MSTLDEILLSDSELEEIARAQRAYQEAAAIGDTAGMQRAHAQAEAVRNAAGYSGGADGSGYSLLYAATDNPTYNAYAGLLNNYAGSGMNAIAAGYGQSMAALQDQRRELMRQADANQMAARSGVWNAQRLAADGLLTRGLSETGLANVITAQALNGAAANAYQAMLDRQNDLAANDQAMIAARADAAGKASQLQQSFGKLLGSAYLSLSEEEAQRAQELLLQQLRNQNALDLQALKNENELDALELRNAFSSAEASEEEQRRLEQMAREYYYQLALLELKRQWQLEDQANRP